MSSKKSPIRCNQMTPGQYDRFLYDLLTYYQEPHTIKEAKAALTDYHPDDIKERTLTLLAARMLTEATRGWWYETNEFGIAHRQNLARHRDLSIITMSR